MISLISSRDLRIVNKYKQIEYEKIEYPATSEILANIKALDKEIAKEMEELEAMLWDMH